MVKKDDNKYRSPYIKSKSSSKGINEKYKSFNDPYINDVKHYIRNPRQEIAIADYHDPTNKPVLRGSGTKQEMWNNIPEDNTWYFKHFTTKNLDGNSRSGKNIHSDPNEPKHLRPFSKLSNNHQSWNKQPKHLKQYYNHYMNKFVKQPFISDKNKTKSTFNSFSQQSPSYDLLPNKKKDWDYHSMKGRMYNQFIPNVAKYLKNYNTMRGKISNMKKTGTKKRSFAKGNIIQQLSSPRKFSNGKQPVALRRLLKDYQHTVRKLNAHNGWNIAPVNHTSLTGNLIENNRVKVITKKSKINDQANAVDHIKKDVHIHETDSNKIGQSAYDSLKNRKIQFKSEQQQKNMKKSKDFTSRGVNNVKNIVTYKLAKGRSSYYNSDADEERINRRYYNYRNYYNDGEESGRNGESYYNRNHSPNNRYHNRKSWRTRETVDDQFGARRVKTDVHVNVHVKNNKYVNIIYNRK